MKQQTLPVVKHNTESVQPESPVENRPSMAEAMKVQRSFFDEIQ